MLIAVPLIAHGTQPVYTPAVKTGDSVTFGVNTTGNAGGFGQIKSIQEVVQSVNLTAENITATQILTFKNGTTQTNTLIGNVQTGDGNLSIWILAGGLSAGDRLWQSPSQSSFMASFNETVTRLYAGALRSVNVLYMTLTYVNTTQISYYWDALTGFLLEVSEITSSFSISFKVTETNVWSPSKQSDFTMDVTPVSEMVVYAGGSSEFRLTLASINNFTGTISLVPTVSNATVANRPTASLNPVNVTLSSTSGSTTSMLTVSATASTPTGLYLVTVNATGSSRSHAAILAVTVQPPDFSITATPANLTIAHGASKTSTITLNALGAFNGTLLLSAYAYPSGLTVSLNPTNVTLSPTVTSASSILTVSTTAPGYYYVIVMATCGNLAHYVLVYVNVTGPDFSISAAPSFLSIRAGQNANSTITVTSLSGFAGVVSLSAYSYWEATLTLNPTNVTLTSGGSANSTLTVSVPASTPPGNYYYVTVEATGGNLTHYVNVYVNVTGPDFTITATPYYLTVRQGSSGISIITVKRLDGFNGTVSLSASSSLQVSQNPSSVILNSSVTSANSTLTVSALSSTPHGFYSVTVTGTSSNVTRYAYLLVNVTGPDFSISAAPANLTIAQGLSDTFTITLTSLAGFAGTVDLSAFSYGLTVSLSPANVTLTSGGSANSTLTVSVPASAAGSYYVTVTGTSGKLSHSDSVIVLVPDFSVSASPSYLTIRQGGTGSSTITLTSMNGFTGTVKLSPFVSSGLYVSLTPASVALTAGGSASSVLTIGAPSSVALGSYFASVTGTSGNLTRYADVWVTVTGPANFQLQVVNASNVPIAGIEITFSNPVTQYIFDSAVTGSDGRTPVVQLPTGQVLATALPGELPYFVASENFTLVLGNNTGTIQLQGLPTGMLTGHVTYTNGSSVTGVLVTASQHVDDRDWNFYATTDSNGNYSMTLLAGEVNIAVSSSMVLAGQTVSIPANGTATLDTKVVLLEPGLVNISLFTRYLGQTQFTGPLPIDWRVAVHFSLNVIDAQGNQYLASQNPVPILGYAGETIHVFVDGRQAGLPSLNQSAQLDSNRNANVSLYLSQQGLIQGTVVTGVPPQPVSSWIANVYSVNATGFKTFIQAISNSTAVLSFSPPAAGLYEIDVRSVSGTGQALYGSVSTLVEQAQIVQLGNITLNAGLYFTGMDGNGVTSTPSQTTPGGTVTLRATYDNTGQVTLRSASLLLEAPAMTSLLSGSITLNFGQVTTASLSGKYYVVPLGDLPPGASGVVRYQLQLSPSFNATALNPSVLVNYTLSAVQHQEIIGTANIHVYQVTIDAPSNLATLNTVISGQGPPGSIVTVYDNYTELGRVTVPTGGFWQLDATLPNTGNVTVHPLHAQATTASGVMLNSGVLSVFYDNAQPVLEQITMEQTDGRSFSFDPSQGTARFPYVVVPWMPMTFELYFSNPTKVTNVEVVAGAYQANATLGSDGVYRATIVPGYELGPIYVNYNVVTFSKGNGTVPILSRQQLIAQLPSNWQNANVTVTSSTKTGFNATVTYPSSALLPNGIVGFVSTNITPNVTYTLTEMDIQSLASTGYPFFNYTYTIANTTDGFSVYVSAFVPYSAVSANLTNFDPPIDQGTTLYARGKTLGGWLVSIGATLSPDTVDQWTQFFTGVSAANKIPYLLTALKAIDKILNFYKLYKDANWYCSDVVTLCQLYDYVGTGGCPTGAFITLLTETLLLGELTISYDTVTAVAEVSNPLEAIVVSCAADYMIHDVLMERWEDSLATEKRHMLDIVSYTPTQPSVPIGYYLPNFPETGHLTPILTGGMLVNLTETGQTPPFAPAADPTWVWDPSGYVYEGLPSNRLANVTVSIFQQDPNTGAWSLWDASAFGQQNPEQTDAEGRYGWDVPTGAYMVVFQKAGYETAQSMIVNVPPPATGINMNVISLTPPTVTGVSAVANSSGSSVEIEFSKYMQASLLTQNTISVAIPGGTVLNGTVVPVNPQPDPNGVLLAQEARFTPTSPLVAGDTYTVNVSDLVESYANVPMTSNYTANVTVQAGVSYAVATSSRAVPLGGSISGNATTSDPLSTSVLFTWYAPGHMPVSEQLVSVSSGNAHSAPFYPGEVGVWSLQANFTDGSTVLQSKSVNFTVTVAPLSTSISPASVTLDAGQSQLLTSIVSGGASPFSYQWYLNGAKVSGATNSTWTFTPSSSGSYTVYLNVTDSVGESAISNNATVTVNAPPSVTISPTSATIDVGQSQLFTSSVINGTSPYSYQWYLNGTLVGTGSTYTFTPGSPGFYNIYLNVTDSVSIKAKSNMATVTVNAALSVTVSPSTWTMYVGQSKLFTSSVSGGTGSYSYQWYLNGVAVSGATSASWTFTPSSTGSYNVYVAVTDARGAVATSTTSTVTVITVIPEFPQMIPLIILLSIASALILALTKRRKPTRRHNQSARKRKREDLVDGKIASEKPVCSWS